MTGSPDALEKFYEETVKTSTQWSTHIHIHSPPGPAHTKPQDSDWMHLVGKYIFHFKKKHRATQVQPSRLPPINVTSKNATNDAGESGRGCKGGEGGGGGADEAQSNRASGHGGHREGAVMKHSHDTTAVTAREKSKKGNGAANLKGPGANNDEAARAGGASAPLANAHLFSGGDHASLIPKTCTFEPMPSQLLTSHLP